MFATEVRNSAGSTISLGVFSAKVRFSAVDLPSTKRFSYSPLVSYQSSNFRSQRETFVYSSMLMIVSAFFVSIQRFQSLFHSSFHHCVYSSISFISPVIESFIRYSVILTPNPRAKKSEKSTSPSLPKTPPWESPSNGPPYP